MASTTNVYPEISIDYIKKPNRVYAFPLLGGLIKSIILIPQLIELSFLVAYGFILVVINSLYVLFNGKYWKYAFEYNVGFSRLAAKVSYFFFGLTDRYPGFTFDQNKILSLSIEYPKKVNRLFAFPFLGFVVRAILVIPYYVYSSVLSYGSYIGVAFTSLIVFFMGKYPESVFEITRDSVRVSQSLTMYLLGMSDSYPSFYISLKHKNIKILLITIGALLVLMNWLSSFSKKQSSFYPYSNYRSVPAPHGIRAT